MDAYQKCQECRYEMGSISSKYFCCNPQEKVCILCKTKVCKKCLNTRQQIYIRNKCIKCYSSSRFKDDRDLYFQYLCEQYFCAKCLAKSLKSNKMVKLPCGHECQQQSYRIFMAKFCFMCGENYDNILDYQLVDGKKLCYKCFRLEGNRVYNLFIRCIQCNNVIRNRDQNNQALKNSQFNICQQCYRESASQEKMYSFHPKAQLKQEKIECYSQAKDYDPKKYQIDKNLKQQQQQQKKKPQQQQEQVQQEQQIVLINPTQFIINKHNNILNQNEKQLAHKISDQDKQYYEQFKKPILESFKYSEKQQIVEQGRKVKMKKHFSTEQFVQNLKLEILQQRQDIKYVECKQCNYILDSQQALKMSKVNQNEFLCKLCYLYLNNNLVYSSWGAYSEKVDLAASRNRHTSTNKYKKQQENIHPLIDSKYNFDKYKIPAPKYADRQRIKNNQFMPNHTKLSAENYIHARKIGQFSKSICQKCQKQCNSLFITDGCRICSNCYYLKRK